MRRAAFHALGFLLFALLTSVSAAAQTPDSTPPAPAPALSREVIAMYAKTYVAVSAARDAVHLELAQERNKTPEAQAQLQEKLRNRIAEILKENALSEEEYRRLTTIVASDPGTRKIFDEIIAELTKKTS